MNLETTRGTLAGRWFGNTTGTHPGSLTLEIEQDGDTIAGMFQHNHEFRGLAYFEVTGSVSGTKVELKIIPDARSKSAGVMAGDISATLVSVGELKGQWQLEDGSKGGITAIRQPESEPYVFISYTHSDGAAWAERLVQRLTDADISHFRDKRSIEWGQSIPDEIHEALQRATHLVVVVSEASKESQWVAYETGYGTGRKISVIPYLVDAEAERPGFMKDAKSLQCEKDLNEFIQGLKDEVARGRKLSAVL